jgi:magnesium-transporting ATPase (P-type)
MWVIFGVIAIITTFINLYMYKAGKDYKLAMAMALSFTALTICADYSYLTRWVKAEDWAALSDVIPGMARAFWFLTIVSILLNIAPIFLERKRKK